MRAGEAGGGVGVAEGVAEPGVGDDAVADVGGFVGGVVLIAREGVGGVESAEGREVVEAFECAGDDGFVAIGVEVACVAGVDEGGKDESGAAAGGGEIDGACFGAGAVEGAVGATVELGAGEGGGGDGAVVEVAADVGGGDAVGEDFVRVGAAATDGEGDGSAGLAGLDDVGAGSLAEVVDDADLCGQGRLRDQRNDGGKLLDGRWDTGGDDGLVG